MKDVQKNLSQLRDTIQKAAIACGRAPEGIDLIAVSKTQPLSLIMDALAAGQRHFGENRVQEAQQKFPALRQDFPDICLHLIGALQTNKAEAAVELFDVIETLDRPKLAAAIAAAMRKTGRQPRLYVEVNIGEEPQKAGILPDALPEFLMECRDRHGLPISGLMCIPPQNLDPTPYFTHLVRLADQHALPHRSMGMSNDYKTAITCGATAVRVGTAIFGVRG